MYGCGRIGGGGGSNQPVCDSITNAKVCTVGNFSNLYLGTHTLLFKARNIDNLESTCSWTVEIKSNTIIDAGTISNM